MTKKEIRKYIRDNYNLAVSYDLFNKNIITSMRDVRDFAINRLSSGRHSIIFLYKSGAFDTQQIIIEDYVI